MWWRRSAALTSCSERWTDDRRRGEGADARDRGALPTAALGIKVCTSVSCYLRGADALLARLEERLGVKKGQTTPDGRFTVDMIECLAACGMAPVLQVNGE